MVRARVVMGLGVIGLVAAGCAGNPSAGPSALRMAQGADPVGASYSLIDISPQTLAGLADSHPAASLRDLPAAPIKGVQHLGVGDRVAVQIWEAASGGLFTASLATDHFSTGARATSLAEQPIGVDGSISIPYAGRVHLAGASVPEAQRRIEHALLGRAIQPQAVVTRVNDVTNLVTITGEVTNGARVPLATGQERLLDVVAQAGSLRAATSETEVAVVRQGMVRRVALSEVMANPRENISMAPGDLVSLVHHKKMFLAYGATGRNAEIPFEADHISLAQGLAKAGGLLDQRADAAGVFVVRVGAGAGDSKGRVYRLDLSTPEGLLQAQQFDLQDHDLIYVSNAPLADAQKTLSFLGSLINPAASGATLAAVTKL